MKDLEIDSPHGYFIDSDGKVVNRFGNFYTGTHTVPDVVNDVEYTDGPAAHEREVHWEYGSGEPPLSISLSNTQIVNDDSDTVDITVSLHDDASKQYDVTLSINDDEFTLTVGPTTDGTEKITSTAESDTVIEVFADHPDCQRSDVRKIEVIQA